MINDLYDVLKNELPFPHWVAFRALPQDEQYRFVELVRDDLLDLLYYRRRQSHLRIPGTQLWIQKRNTFRVLTFVFSLILVIAMRNILLNIGNVVSIHPTLEDIDLKK
jgi:hypothetical protein